MSSEFWSNLSEKKKKELLESTQTKASSQTSSSSVSKPSEELKTSDFWSALSPEKQYELLTRGTTNIDAPIRTFMQDDDDIAPVKGGNKNSVFKSGGFSDGVDGVGDFFGDLGQTVLGTTADLGLGILKGAGRLVEGIVDLGTYGVAGVADLFGADEFAEKTKKVARYSATDEWTKDAVNYVDQYSVLGNKADMVSEGIGQVGGIILTGGIGTAAGLSTAATTALTTGTMFASGMGSGMTEAYGMGASDGKAVAYGATVGAVEAVSEMIFGGLGKGVKALGVSKGLTSIDDVVAKKISNAAAKYITSEAGQKVVGNTLEYAVKSGAEGLEEVISGFGSAIAKDVYLMNGEDEKAFGEILKDEKLLEQFVVGSIVSGIAQGGDFIKSTKNGRDFISGLSKNEQTVVDKVYEQRLAEESENKTLSNKDKNKLYERVVEEMKRGYITTDEIESILGGEAYEGYKSLTEKQKLLEERKAAIENEIKELVKTPESQFTIEQREKLTSLREEAKGIKEELQNLGIKTAKNKLFNEVNKLTSKDTYLRESYNDLIRQTQDIDIDENQYKGTKFEDAAKKTIANARNAGASNSNRVRDFVEFSAKYSSVSGKVIDFKKDADIKGTLVNQLKSQIDTLSKSTTAEDKKKLAELQDTLKKVQEGEIRVNGVKTKDGVAININSSNYLNTVLGHEVTHFLESNKAYEALQKAIFKYAQSKGDYEGRRKVLDALYKNIDGTTVDYELTADLVGDYIFTEYDFIKNLSTENRNVFQQIYDQIKYMFKLATAGSKEARELEKVMHNFEKVLRESVGTKNTTENSGVKYSLVVKETNGKEHIVNPYNITRDDVVDFLKKSSKGDLENNTYFPIASNTPQTIISTLKNAGVVTTDKPLAMQAKKARQSQTDAKPYTTKDGIVTRFHKMSAEEIIETIEKLNDPEIAIYQTNRTKTITNKDGTKTKVPAPDNFAFFVTLDSGKESVAVVEFDSVIDENYLLQDGKGEEYHTTVTVFIPDIMRDGMPFDYAEYLLRDGNNIEIDIIKESPKTKSAYSEILATDSETELSDDIISQKEKNVNTQFSVSTDIDGNTIDAERISSNEFDTKYSISHNADIAKGQAEYFSKNKAYISADELKEAQRVTNAMVDVMMKYSSILPEDKIGKVLTKNGSYDRSVENTTICVRTLAYNEFVDKVQEEIGRPLTQMESFLVSQKLYDIATEPQCLYCYVSLDRKAFNDMLLRYMQDRDTVIAKYNNSNKSSEAISKLYEEFLNGRKDTKEMKSRFDNWLNYVDNGTQLLSLADIATEDRQSVIKAEGGNLSEQLADARKYAQNASWSKIQKNYVAYRDEILKLGDRVVKNLNEHYGLRWYSFSDYSAAFIVENMQQITDASIRGLKGLSYTKDTDYAEIFAPSGMNINISVFVNQDADGNFYIDEKQSANFEKALELREQYPNVGIVATVTNDEALRWVGEQGWSDVIIPFHIVRTGADVAEYYKWLNYTSESADTVGDKNLWDAYVDSLNPKTENARKKVSKNIYPSEHQNNKATYLALCESRGLTPRFARFAGEAWYMKLVNETRLSADNSSVLKPNYNLDAAKTSFQKFVDKGGYEGGWYKDGVNVDEEVSIVANDVLAGKKANEVDYGRQDGFAPENLIANRKDNRTHGKLSLSYEGENRTLGGSYRFDGKDFLKSDIAPVAEGVAKNAPTQTVEDTTFDAPMLENIPVLPDEELEQGTIAAIRPKPEKQPSMKKVDNTESTEHIAQVLTEEPKVEKKKKGIISTLVQNFVDKGAVFENLSLKTKNRALQDTYKAMGRSETKAQYFMENGTEGVKSLDSIREEVEQTGKTKEFYEYLYHKHNVDRMSLESKEQPNLRRLEAKMKELKLDKLQENQLKAIASEKITNETAQKRADLIKTVREYLKSKDVKNKPVFDYSVTAEMSQNIAKELESANPDFKEYAQDVYNYMNHLRQMMVDKGVISQETADLWAKTYPFYVPIRRAGHDGSAVNVPLDTNKTGINAPIKRATGGNSDILPLFETMAQRTSQTFKAIDKNSFGVELKNTLGNVVESTKTNIDEVIDSIDAHESLLQEGKNGRNPTFTVFENGERVTFEITDEMYDALKPAEGLLASTFKPLNTASNLHRGVLTEYSVPFMASNAVKDAQDVLFNSQHPVKTYANFPTAVNELLTKGKWYTEYMENGGGDNTYFDKQTNTFNKEKSALRKIFGFPFDKISDANNFIEKVPRLAEYIASRESGASIDAAMLDAARVTTDFSAGGDVTKFLNRNGATFLNASMQGAAQVVRNVREAKMNGLKGVLGLATKTMLAGLPAMLLNHLLWDDDEEYEELSDYVKENYYIVGKYGDGKFVRIPKGRAVAVVQSAFEQISNTLTGDDEADWGRFAELALSNLAPNDPSNNNILAPIKQVMTNKTWYGEDLVPTRLQDLPAAEQYDESTDAISKWLGENLNVSPYKINYLLNQYSGGVGDILLPMMTPEAESGDNSLLGNFVAPLKDKFTTDSVMNNQNVSDFYSKADELKVKANSSYATEEDILKYKYINSVNSELGELYKAKREIQNSNLSDSVKYAQVREIQKQINALAKESLNTYGNVVSDDNYANVGDKHYKQNDDGEWQKISDKQVEKQAPFVKVYGGYSAYLTYSSDLYDIKADKDENGKSISGSRKEKVINYINNLDADYETKIILFKSEYPSDDTYNMEIINYINNRTDLTYEERVAIFTELGFTVSNGSVYWD